MRGTGVLRVSRAQVDLSARCREYSLRTVLPLINRAVSVGGGPTFLKFKLRRVHSSQELHRLIGLRFIA